MALESSSCRWCQAMGATTEAELTGPLRVRLHSSVRIAGDAGDCRSAVAQHGGSVDGGRSPLASHFFIDFPPVRPTRRQRIQVIVEYTNRYVQGNYVGFARDAGKVEEW